MIMKDAHISLVIPSNTHINLVIPEGYTTCGDPVGHHAYKVHYPIDKANRYPSFRSKQSTTTTTQYSLN